MGFNLRSSGPFKMMGSSPVKSDDKVAKTKVLPTIEVSGGKGGKSLAVRDYDTQLEKNAAIEYGRKNEGFKDKYKDLSEEEKIRWRAQVQKNQANSPLPQKIDFNKSNDYSKSNNYKTKTTKTTEQDRREGDIAINDPIKNPDGSLSSSEGMYGPGKGKQLSELSKKELEALGFSPEKIKEIKANKTAK